MRLLVSIGVLLSLLWLSLAIWSNQLTPVPILGMLAIQLAAWILVIGLWWWYRDEKDLSIKTIIWLAILMRLPSFYAFPIYEDDYCRFLWDGWNFVSEGTPYNGPPADYFDDPEHTEAIQEVLYNVNYPNVPTIYAPICQTFFAIGAMLEPLKLWSLRLVILLVELVVIVLFSRMASARQLLLFAWCPLLVFESLFQVHPDVLAASFLFLAYLSRKNESHWLTGLCGALALGVKITILPAIAFLLWPLRKQAILTFCCTVIAMYLPFLLQGSRADFDGLAVFAREWEFNASLYSIAAPYFQSSVRFLMLAIFTTAFLSIWLAWQRKGALQREIPQTLVVVYGILFLVSPVVNSWYLLIILPFVCLAPRPWSIAALVLVSLSYVRGQTLPKSPLDDFHQPLWLLVFEYTIVIGLAVCTFIYTRSKSSDNG